MLSFCKSRFAERGIEAHLVDLKESKLPEAVFDFVTAMVTSVRAVVMSPLPMIGWALIIVVLLIVSALPYFLGLLVTLPVLGHATWHLYRRIVVPL